MLYEVLYKKIGVHKLDHFVHPRILVDTDFIFPKKSDLSWFRVGPIVETPNNKIGYLSNVKDKSIVITRYLYAEPIGNFKSKESNISKVVKEQQKLHPEFLFIKPKTKRLKVTADRLVINSYGALAGIHIYRPYPEKVYDRWRNAFNTLVHNLNVSNIESDRQLYINLDLPSNIPSKEVFDRFVDQKPKRMLEHFPTSKHLNLLEFWKFMTPELRESSILNKIDKKNYERINFIFTYNNKIALMNFKNLISTVKEYDTSTSIQEYPAKTMRKLLLIFFLKIKNEGAKTFTELDDKKAEIGFNNMMDIDDSDMGAVNPDLLLEEEFEDEIDTPNYDDMSDDLLEANNINVAVDEIDDGVENIEDLNVGMDPKDKIKKQVDLLKETKGLTKRDVEIIEESLVNQSKMKNPYGDSKETLQEMLTVTDKDIEIPEDLISLPDINVIEDKTMLSDPIKAMDKHYIDKVYKKDILSSIYAIQNNDVVIRSHEIERSKDILGGVEVHTIELKPLSGKPSKVTFRIPSMEEDGTFMLSGNKYVLRKQRGDIPFRKIASDKIALSSYYGKSFITKSDFKKDQIGYWFRKKLIAISETNKKISNLVFMPIKLMDVKTPPLYSNIAMYVKMFKLGNIKYSFDFHERKELLDGINKDLKEIEGNKYVLFGRELNTNNVVLMDVKGKLYKRNATGSKIDEMDDLFTQLELDVSSLPIENITIKVFKQRLPVGLLLAYYLGFTKLLKVLKTKYVKMERGKRYSLEDDEYSVVFKDYKLILKRDDGLSSLIIGGFKNLHKEIKSIEMVLLDKKESFPVLFNALNLPSLYVNEIRLLEDMFVDPITKSVLKSLDLPETFKGLLIHSAKALLDNDYVDPNDSSAMIIRGHERIAGMIYTEMVGSLREFENKNTFSKSKIVVDPYAIWRKINNDSTVMLADDLNPIAALKQTEDLTYMGDGGLNKDAISQDKRIYHPSEVGVISEAVKDSGDVGISAYMSANPKIKDVRGKVVENKGKMNPSNYFSTSALLSPSSDRDDGKRANFIQIQNGHVIPINDMSAPVVRTGYEAILPYRLGEDYCYMAEDDGVVESVNGSKNIKVTFKSGKKKTIKLGSWNSKEESGVSYKHTLITNLKKGDKFKKGNTISYDNAFFEPDIFDTTRIIFKTGTSLRMALMETSSTYEDATTISHKVSNKLGTTITKSKSFVLDIEDNIINMVSIGDKVEPNDLLFSIATSNLVDEDGKFDKDSLAILQNIKNRSPKAKMRGKIQNIKVFYNCDITELSKTLKNLAEESDKRLDGEFTGKVNSSYSIKGKPLNINQVEVKVYIEDDIKANIADKLVMALQLKCTISDVYKNELKSEDGLDVEGTFSTKSISNRIVLSTTSNSTATTVMKVLKNKVVEDYFK